MKRSGFLKRRTPLKKQSDSSVSKLKRDIQAKLRQRAIERDGSCVIGQYQHWLPFQYQECGPHRNDGELILQAEHLVGRANSASYADMDNIILLCMRHHFFFKKQHGALYWELVRKHIGEARWAKVQQYELDHFPHHFVKQDWKDQLDGL